MTTDQQKTLDEIAALLSRAIVDFAKALAPLGGYPDAKYGSALHVKLSVAPGPYTFDGTLMAAIRERLAADMVAKPNRHVRLDSIGGVSHETKFNVIGFLCAPPCPLAFEVVLTHPVDSDIKREFSMGLNALLEKVK